MMPADLGRTGVGVPMDATDFRAAEAFYEPQSPDLWLSLSPALVLVLLLLGAAAFLGGLWLGRRRRPAEDATADVWKAIDGACQAAMKANSDALPDKARALRQAVEDRLGPVLRLSDGLAKPVKALDEALKARVAVDPADKPSHGDHGHGPGHGAAPAAVTVVSNSHVVIKDGRAAAKPHEDKPGDHDGAHGPATKDGHHGPAKPHEPPRMRDMTVEERADALRRAVSRLNDHWCQKAVRLAELRAARRALIRTAPLPKAPVWTQPKA